ncbi:DUF2535 domain-containing protein [Bacillus sp. M6-12]|uniref:DUF2535 family protein n=1 Tax=Bacillus sp. M6-12 TaxID=2054166 RepID=UPI000C762A6D|nr:DUF2535 family protein [Bacillus sp. M6-12]PLS16257.1 DUF2535 domain-containing protein [Bacillus sp. M6-12]
MLFKSLEFKNAVGQKVKIIHIPVLEEDNTYHFMISARLEMLMRTVYKATDAKIVYSFKDHLRQVLKWPVYEQLFQHEELKNNA